MNTTKSDLVIKIFDTLDAQGVNFVTLQGFELLPDKVSIKKDVDLLIHPDSAGSALMIFEGCGFIASNGYPQGTVCLYGTRPSIFYDHKQLDIRFHVVYELSYRSLNKGEKIPVDKMLQNSIFQNKMSVGEIWRYMPSAEDEFLMLICRCIYDKRTVPQWYKDKIEKLFSEIAPEKRQKHCELVFLKFTPQLLATIEKKETEYIFEKYITFCDY